MWTLIKVIIIFGYHFTQTAAGDTAPHRARIHPAVADDTFSPLISISFLCNYCASPSSRRTHQHKWSRCDNASQQQVVFCVACTGQLNPPDIVSSLTGVYVTSESASTNSPLIINVKARGLAFDLAQTLPCTLLSPGKEALVNL